MLPSRAAAAVRTLPRVASVMPMYPVRPEAMQPRMNATVRAVPDAANDSADDSSGRRISVDVKNTIAATGTTMTAMVRNCRFRYAAAPSWIAFAISRIFGVPSSAASTDRAR